LPCRNMFFWSIDNIVVKVQVYYY